MDFSLSSSLVGSAVLNPDRLSLDLQFAADKTLTARKGPTPTFTRASTATFVGSNGLIQSAAVNAPRFDHDPLTLACKGLLIEESRTNSLVQSADFSTTWSQIQVAVSTNVTTSPSGDVTADKVVPNFASTISRVSQTFTLTGSHSMSVFAKSSEWGWLFIGPISGGVGVWFDLSNGTVGTQSSGFVGSIVSFGNGWYRCAVSFTGATTSQPARIVPTNADNTITIGDGTSGIFIWGAQVEAGSFATSYIPTVASTAVRSADVCSITGSDFTGFYNQSEGTVSMSASTARSGNSVVLYAITDGTISNQILALPGSSSFSVNVLGSSQASLDTGIFTNNVVSRVASAFKLNNFASSKNGGTVSTDNAGTLPTVSQLGIGSRISAVQLNGHIQYLRYFKKRLANAKLITLTT
jgi:hypothetical protein